MKMFVVKYNLYYYAHARAAKGVGAVSGFLEKLAEVFRSDEYEKSHPFTSAVILCAGSGTRFAPDGSVTKQNVLVCGVPVAVRSILAFEACKFADEIIVVCRADEIAAFEAYRAEYGFAKVARIVEGGATRQESSLRGFEATDDKSKYVMIHDGARCLVTTEIIEATARAAYKHRAAVAAERCRDTVKLSENGKTTTDTADRDRIWLAKTPQAFYSNLYRAAAYMAKKDGATVTDDASMAERLGFEVALVDCGSQNLKITYPEDVILAEAIIKARESADKEVERDD